MHKLHFPENYVKPVLPGRDEWIKALRSGQYPQTKKRLCDEKGYCCLGVLSKIQGRLTKVNNTWCDKEENSECLNRSNPLFPILEGAGRFPEGVYFSYGIFGTDNYNYLSMANDLGIKFKDIADMIEQIWAESPAIA